MLQSEKQKMKRELCSLSFNDYQSKALVTAIYPRGKAMEYVTLGLCSEAGELAGKIKKVVRDHPPGTSLENLPENSRKALVSELGDCLWYVAMLAWELGVPLKEVAQVNIDKLADRLARDKLGGSGDNR